MVHQHFMLIPVMTVAENVVLASEPTRGRLLLDYAEAERRVRELSERFGLTVDPAARIESIGVGQQQRVEILKALYRGAEILDPRRADRRAHAAGGRGAVRHHPQPHRAGQVRDLHHAQAARGARGRRPDHGAAPRQARRDDPARGRDRGEPRARDGRPRGAAPRRQEARASPASRCSSSTTCTSSTRAGCEAVRGVSFDGACRRDRRRRRRRRQRPVGADRRAHGPAPRRRRAT